MNTDYYSGLSWPRILPRSPCQGLEPGLHEGMHCDRTLSPAGYTHGMKTAVSIPDEVFRQADRLAKRMNTSRSEVYSRALREYIARHGKNQVTEMMDRVVEEVGAVSDEFVATASAERLEETEW